MGIKRFAKSKHGTAGVGGKEVPEGEQGERREAEEPCLQDGQDHKGVLSVAQTPPESRGRSDSPHQEVE